MKTSTVLLIGYVFAIMVGVVAIAVVAKKEGRAHLHMGKGIESDVDRIVEPFNKLVVQGPVQVYLLQGPKIGVQLQGDRGQLELVQTTVNQEVLTILLQEQTNEDTVKVYVHFLDLKALTMVGGAQVHTLAPLKTTELKMASTAATASLDLECNALAVKDLGGSQMTLRGQAGLVALEYGAGTSLNAHGLSAAKCKAVGNTGGKAYVYVTDQLEASVAKGALLEYDGTALVNILNENEGGTVQRR